MTAPLSGTCHNPLKNRPDTLLAALSAAGSPCVDPSPVANPTAKGALSMVDCGSAPGRSDVVVFDSQAVAQGFAEDMTAPGPLSADAMVYGRNWAVNDTRAYAPLVQHALGGGVNSTAQTPVQAERMRFPCAPKLWSA